MKGMGSVKARVEFPYKQRSQKSLIKEKSWDIYYTTELFQQIIWLSI